MSVPSDFSEILKDKKRNLNEDLMEKLKNLSLESKSEIQEEFPKLRRPKASTMLKTEISKNVEQFTEINISNVPLRQEFLNKKEEMEKTALTIIKKYVLGNVPEKFLDEEPQPITINKNFDISSLIKSSEQETPTDILNTTKWTQNQLQPMTKNNVLGMTYSDLHLVNILHTKIKAHPNGFFANNIPNWYKTTFDKIIPTNWLDIVKQSNKFCLENINTKVVLYALEDENETQDIDTYASGDMVKNTKYDTAANINDKTEIATGFVRYKHLEKSLQRYKYNAGHNILYKTNELSTKSSDIVNKSNLTKSNIRYKHLQGTSSKK